MIDNQKYVIYYDGDYDTEFESLPDVDQHIKGAIKDAECLAELFSVYKRINFDVKIEDIKIIWDHL